MGSTYTVKIAGAALSAAGRGRGARRGRTARSTPSTRAMSTYRPDSELSRFNAHAATTPFALSAETLAVFALAQRGERADGRRVRHHGRAARRRLGLRPGAAQRVVGDAEVGALGARVGWRMLALDDGGAHRREGAPRTCAPTCPASPRATASTGRRWRSTRWASRDYMVEAGGEVRTRGLNAEGRPWQIAIEQPDAVPQRPHFVVPLAGQSMATSGDYRIYFERDGQRYSHEIDPATGAPIRNGLASVSVVAADCGYADAMATALIVLGAGRGLRAGRAARDSPPSSSCASRAARYAIGRRRRSPRSAAAGVA